MKNNSMLVTAAVVIATTAVLAGQLSHESKDSQALLNSNVYGLSRTGNCILADPDDLKNGCVVSSTGYICQVWIVDGGLVQHVQAYASPISIPFCALTIKSPTP